MLGIVHDEHALHIQTNTVARLAVKQVKGRPRRDVEQLRVFLPALDAVVRVGERWLEIMTDIFVELVVLLFGDIGLGPRPQCARLVDRLQLCRCRGFLGVLDSLSGLGLRRLRRLGHQNRNGDVVGVFAQDGFELPIVEQLVLALAQVQHDFGAARGFLGWLQRVLAAALAHVAFPAHGIGGAGAARQHGHFVGNDERRIKTHAKLADHARVLGLVAGK